MTLAVDVEPTSGTSRFRLMIRDGDQVIGEYERTGEKDIERKKAEIASAADYLLELPQARTVRSPMGRRSSHQGRQGRVRQQARRDLERALAQAALAERLVRCKRSVTTCVHGIEDIRRELGVSILGRLADSAHLTDSRKPRLPQHGMVIQTARQLLSVVEEDFFEEHSRAHLPSGWYPSLHGVVKEFQP